MILGVPLGIVLYYLGSRLLVQGGIDLTPRDRGSTTIQLYLFGLAVLISISPFIVSLVHIDDSQVMLQCTFGAFIADIGLAAVLLILLLSRSLKGMRLEMAVVGLGTMFLTVISFTGYLSFDESVLLLLLMILVIMIPYLTDIWKTGVDRLGPLVDAARSGRSRGVSAAMLVAGFLITLAATAMGILGLVYPAYDDYLTSQVVLAFIVAVVVTVMQVMPSLILYRKNLKMPAVLLLVVCIFLNGLFAFLAVCFLPLTEI